MNDTAEPGTVSARRATDRIATAAPLAASPRSRLLAGAFIAAPLLLLASSVAFAAGSEPLRGVLQFYAFAVFVLVILTLTDALAGVFPRAAVALTLVGVLGMAAGVGFAVDNLHGALLDDAYLVDDGGIAGVFVANIPGLMGPLAFIGIGLALLRAEVEPRFSGVALVTAGLLFPVSRIGELPALAIVDDLIFLLALAPLGWAMLQGREILRAGR